MINPIYYGEVGEYILDQVESVADERIDVNTFFFKLREIGLADIDIMKLYAQEILEI